MMMIAREWGKEGSGKGLLDGYRVSVLHDEKILI
jgi:hypothetical protein